jgi:hypothetical protein
MFTIFHSSGRRSCVACPGYHIPAPLALKLTASSLKQSPIPRLLRHGENFSGKIFFTFRFSYLPGLSVTQKRSFSTENVTVKVTNFVAR